MRYAGEAINKALIKLLETDNDVVTTSNDLVNVYTTVPNGARFPMIIVEPSSSSEDDTSSDSIDQIYIHNVEVISKLRSGVGGWSENDFITNQLTGFLRGINQYLDLSPDNFSVKEQTLSIQPIREAYDDGVYLRTIISLEIRLQETD